MAANTRELILQAARQSAQAHGYGGLNFRDLAMQVGIQAASIHYYFPGKADLGAAIARRYWEDAEMALKTLSNELPTPIERLRRYPDIFRTALENENRLCLGSFMAAEYDDLPDTVAIEIQAFADVNIAWLGREISAAFMAEPEASGRRASAIFAALAGAQLLARSRADMSFYDSAVESFRIAGLLPA